MEENSYSVKFLQKQYCFVEIYRYISDELFAEDAANNLLERIETSILGLKTFYILL